MSNNFTLEQLTEGIRQRHLGTQNKRLIEKWSRTGLLRGLNETGRENMARLLENQAAQVLKEASTLSTGGGNLTSSGDLRGFSNIAFPIVRRVFGGLVANELVSVQPMSLPSGLLFYLDYTYGNTVGDDGSGTGTYVAGQSIYSSPTGRGIRSGSLAVGGQYDLVGSGFSRVHKQTGTVTLLASGAFGGTTTFSNARVLHATGSDGKLLGFDPQVADAVEGNSNGPGAATGDGVYTAVVVSYTALHFSASDGTMVKDFVLHRAGGGAGTVYKGVSPTIQAGGSNVMNVRRLNRLGTWSGNGFVDNPLVQPGDANAALLMVVSGANAAASVDTLNVDFVVASSLNVDSSDGSTLTVPAFESNMADQGSATSPTIPEIDIKVESIAVTAVTRKLRAKWSPELAQDLNAYHSLDAEVELTQILSEQIAMELDREILNDLLTQASGANYYWSRAPGKFVNKATGAEVLRATSAPGPAFTGTVREWYETFVETIIDVANQIHRKTLRGSANFIVVGPDLATILEASVYYRPSYTLDGQGQVSSPMSIGCEKVGTLSNRFTVYKDPYFPRNKVLVGYKGGSYLETGFVYAPYVPLIVTPTIFNPDDFTPRKGVMTRYGKKMVRSDFYGTLTVLDLNII